MFPVCDTRGRQGVTYRQSGTAMPPRSTFAGSHRVLAEILKTRTGRRLRGLPGADEQED